MNVSETVRDTDILIGSYTHTRYSKVSFQMTLSDLERLSKIFNDTKHRAVSLRHPFVNPSLSSSLLSSSITPLLFTPGSKPTFSQILSTLMDYGDLVVTLRTCYGALQIVVLLLLLLLLLPTGLPS